MVKIYSLESTNHQWMVDYVLESDTNEAYALLTFCAVVCIRFIHFPRDITEEVFLAESMFIRCGCVSSFLSATFESISATAFTSLVLRNLETDVALIEVSYLSPSGA
jgi:hypothetical protein